MLTGDVRPSTLEGVKRLATQIRKERGIKHSNALELAAQAASCANYRHAQRTLPAASSSPTKHLLFLTVYWYDKGDDHRCGRETLKVELSKPILHLCGKSDLKLVRGFGTMRMAAADHFVSDTLAQTQNYARSVIGKAERSLRFMEHTGLRPSRDYRAAWPDRSLTSKLPDSDHPTDWIDPVSGQFILIDEPYSGGPNAADRTAWADQYGWLLRKSSWPGMYYPYNCDLYVATNGNGTYDFDALLTKIDAIPAPLSEENWVGESGPFFDVFISPSAKTPQDCRRARSKATIKPKSSNTTIPFSTNLGNLGRRPAGSMPITDHIQIGKIIKSILHFAELPFGVQRRMNTLRSTLENWLALEIDPKQLNGPEFFDVYYHDTDSEGPYVKAAQSRAGLIRILSKLKQSLQTAYPDCAPLRKQLRCIDVSVSLIRRTNIISD